MNLITTITTTFKVLQSAWMLASYLDEIKNLIEQAEVLFPESGKGRTRLQWLRTRLEVTLGIRDKLEKLWPYVDQYVAWYVDKYINKN